MINFLDDRRALTSDDVRVPRWLLVVLSCLGLTLIGPAAHALDRPMTDLNDTEITVPVAKAEIHAISASIGAFDTVFIGNTLTTCIRVGGATLTTTSGYDIGSGCRDGVNVTINANRVFVMSQTGVAIAGVDIVWGKR